MNKELIKSFIDKWNVGYEDKEQKAELAADMEADLMAILQPTQPDLSAIEIFKKHGAHYYEDDEQDIINAMEEYRNQPAQVTHPRPPQKEAEQMSSVYGYAISVHILNYTISALQLRGLDTTYEEEVLTILKGM